MKQFFRIFMASSMLASGALADETDVRFVGNASSCQYQYTNIDGIVTEGLMSCTIDWDYPNRVPNTGSVSFSITRVYDLRLHVICTMSGYQAAGISLCRTVQELRQIDSDHAAELVRRFDWLQAWMRTSESNLQPKLEEFNVLTATQGG